MEIIKRTRSESTVPLQNGLETPMDLRRSVQNLFQDLLGGVGRGLLWPAPSWLHSESVDIAESDNGYTITTTLPCAEEKEITIERDNDRLFISYAKEMKSDAKQKGHRISKRSYGRLERFVAVPKDVNTEQLKASFMNGVLTITLPKSEAASSMEEALHTCATQEGDSLRKL